MGKRTHDLGGLLLRNIQLRLHSLKELLGKLDEHWGGEDGIYRFYHHSFKVYALQGYTEKVVQEMRNCDPRSHGEKKYYSQVGREFAPLFEDIIKAGTGIKFHHDHNHDWTKHTRPIIEAFFHAHHVLTMMVKYGEELDDAPQMLPSGWATVLYMYGLR